ncbi:MAG TPA: type I-E CRISPR-associated protein Cas5/CasD [Hyphomicrobiaceae bacterium]|nr:type I-E CRISPR-associated protein Cas5/CasD [Hyphomicrobiaceae bacterium]
MRPHLVFTLSAPLASFGSVAVGERRPTWNRPSKSQVIGLVAAALGIERTHEARLKALADGLGFAVRVDAAGRLAVDYHTAQSPKDASLRRRAKAVGPVRTRSDELACDDLKTILSRREFRSGILHTIALWRTVEGDPALAHIAKGLISPVFVPYAGRKAHVLMLPMSPRVVAANWIEDAFGSYDDGQPKEVADLQERLGIRRDKDRPIYCDVSAIPYDEQAARVARLEARRDLPEGRAKWRFGLRTEALLKPSSSGKKAS